MKIGARLNKPRPCGTFLFAHYLFVVQVHFPNVDNSPKGTLEFGHFLLGREPNSGILFKISI